MYLKKSYFIFLISIFFAYSGQSQINFKVGYQTGYTNLSSTNAILESYNDAQLNLEQSFKTVTSMHGAHVGTRYKIGSGFGIELNWESMSSNKEAVGFDTDDLVFTQKYYFSLTSLGLGFETYIGKFGYGASMDRTRYQIKTDIDGVDIKRKIQTDSKYSSKFYLLFTIQESSSVALVLKPYTQISWGTYDLSLFEAEVQPTISTPSLTERPWIIGLSVLFYNGKQ